MNRARRLALLALAWALAFAGPAAAIGTPVAISAGSNIQSSGVGFATTVDCPVGSLLIVAVIASNTVNSPISSVTLSNGDTPLQAVQSVTSVALANAGIWYVNNTANDLPVASTITVTTAGTAYTAQAWCVQSATVGLDVTQRQNVLTPATSSTLATGTLSNQPQIIFTVTRIGTVLFSGWNPGAGFTALLNMESGKAEVDYAIVGATTTVTYGPSWTNSNTISQVLATFGGTASAQAGGMLFRGAQ